jgi:hypothetical protein
MRTKTKRVKIEHCLGTDNVWLTIHGEETKISVLELMDLLDAGKRIREQILGNPLVLYSR